MLDLDHSIYEAFELRRHAPHLVAETVVNAAAGEAGNKGFRILAAYIFGQNKGARKIEMTAPVSQTASQIAMTAPVAQMAGATGYVIQFAMPPEWTLETLPEPLDARVTLREMPARELAVISYSGTWSQERYEEQLTMLRDAMAYEGLAAHGEPVWARYDPPWKPWFLRHNEIWLEVDEGGATSTRQAGRRMPKVSSASRALLECHSHPRKARTKRRTLTLLAAVNRCRTRGPATSAPAIRA